MAWPFSVMLLSNSRQCLKYHHECFNFHMLTNSSLTITLGFCAMHSDRVVQYTINTLIHTQNFTFYTKWKSKFVKKIFPPSVAMSSQQFFLSRPKYFQVKCTAILLEKKVSWSCDVCTQSTVDSKHWSHSTFETQGGIWQKAKFPECCSFSQRCNEMLQVSYAWP